MAAARQALPLMAALVTACHCARPAVRPQIVENGGRADFDLWLGECPYDSNSSCRGLVKAVGQGRVLPSFEESGFRLIASGMNRMFALTSTYAYSYSANGEHEYEAINLRYFTTSSDRGVLCDQAAIFQLKKADGLVYAAVTEAVDTDDAFGLSFLKDGQRGNRLWVKPYALAPIRGDPNASLPVLTLTLLPTTVLSRITKRACTAVEINDGETGCFDYVLRKTRHDKLVLRLPVHTVKSKGGGHNEVEEVCWRAYALDQGELLSEGASSASRGPELSWFLLAALIALVLMVARGR